MVEGKKHHHHGVAHRPHDAATSDDPDPVKQRQRHYSMKVVTHVGSKEHIEWGWSAYEQRRRRSHLFRLWDGFIAGLAILQFTLISTQATFAPFMDSLLAITYVLDVCNVIDICVSVVKRYKMDQRNVELRKGNSKLDAYLWSWFMVDLLSVAPLEALSITVSEQMKMPFLAFLRCNRLLCGYKTFRFLNALEAEVGASFVTIRAAYYTILSWLMLHITACIWFLIPCHDWSEVQDGMPLCTAPSWVFSGADPLNGTSLYGPESAPSPNKNIYAGCFDHGLGGPESGYVRLNATVGEKYYYSIYWAVMTTTSVGLGEVHAITFPEMVFSVVAQLAGMIVLFGIIQGGITSMLTNFDTIQFRYKHRVAAITQYLRDQNQSTELVRNVTDFYDYLWKRSKGMSSSGLFDQLPFALRSEIAMELSGRIIDKSPLFQDISASFLRMLSLKFRPMLALPKETIMKKGDLSDLMVYIQNGELEVLSDDETEVPVILFKPGKLFGEINLITRMPRKFTVRAIAHCDLVVLRTEDLMDCLQSYPDIADELRQRAEERTGVAQQKVEEGLLAHTDNHEAVKRKKQQKELAAKMEELKAEMGINLRPLMTALNIDRPQETLKVSNSMELFKIRDPMDEMVEYNMGSFSRRLISRYHRLKIAFFELSIDPDGLFYYFWQRMMLFLVLVTFFLYTYVGFFQSYNQLVTTPVGMVILAMSYIVDIVFMVDYGFKFVTQIVTANGKITEHKAMARAYMNTWGCYTDFLAVLPLDVFAPIGIASNTQWSLLSYLKLNRILRVLTLPRFFDQMTANLDTSTASVRIVKFMLYIALATQICTVLLFLSACSPERCADDPKYSWPPAVPPNISNTDSPADYRYTSALYFAVTMMTTIGYGDLYPHSLIEQLVCNVVMIAGVLMYGYCLAVLTATIANMDAPRVEFQDRLFAMMKFMEYNKLARIVQDRAIDSVALLWTMSKGEEIPGVKNMCEDMPEHLTEEIQVDDLIHLVAGVPIFKNIEERILKNFAPAVRRYLFPPGEYIIQAGDLIDELFVIRRGFCSMFHPEQQGVCIGILHPRMYFGEIGFIFNRNEIISVKTITHCEVLAIPRPAFDYVATSVEWLQHQMNRISEDGDYYENLVEAAKQAKPYAKKRKQQSPTRLTDSEKRKLHFREDLNAVHVSRWAAYLTRLLMSYTVPMDGTFLLVWERIRLAECLLLFVLSMVQTAFQIDDWFYFGVLYALDLYAITDLYLKFHIQYANDMNIVVTHPLMTAKRYLSSTFFMDFIALFPFEFFMLLVPDGLSRAEILHWVMYCRLNRCLQIYRIPLAFSFMEADIKVDTSSLLLKKYCIYFIVFITFITCIPVTLECLPNKCAITSAGCYFKIQNKTQSDLNIQLDIDFPDYIDDISTVGLTRRPWTSHFTRHSDLSRVKRQAVTSPAPDADGYINLDTSLVCLGQCFLHNGGIDETTDNWTRFVASFYWAVTTTTSTGYGDLYATNQLEQVVFLFSMISGNIFYGYIVASIAAAQANSDAQRSRFFERLVAVKQYMLHERLGKNLRKRVVKYYEYLWMRTHGVDPQTLIVGLPPSLTGELALQLYKKVIEQIQIFKNTPAGFKKMLAAIIRPLYIIEGEYVIRCGDIGADLFFLYRGTMDLIYTNGEVSPAIVRSGRILGEVAFLTNQKANTSYRARENSDLYFITKNDFDIVLEHFPEVRERLMDEAKESMERETENQLLFEKRPHKKTLQNSLIYRPPETVPLRDRLDKAVRHIFRPDDKFIRYFSKFSMMGLRTVSVMLILFQPSFNSYGMELYAANYILEVVFLFNIILTLKTGFLDEFGNEVMIPVSIRQRYLRSRNGLLLDCFACCPYEIFALTAPGEIQPQIWGYLRLLRIPARLLRIQEFFKNWLSELDINMLTVRLTFSFTQLALWLHFFTGVAYYIACPHGYCNPQSWIKNTLLVYNHTAEQAYVTSFYWVANTATSTGYGDIIPPTNLSRIFSCIVQIVGKCLFGFIIGDIASALANAEISRQNFESQFQAIKTYLLDQHASKPIIDRVQNYFNYLWIISRGINDIASVLSDAPFCLRTEIGFAVHNRDLRQLPLFRDASDAFIRMVSAHLHQVQFVPGDFIIQQGDLVQEIYFLHRGEAVEVETGVEIGVIRHGSHINWQAVLIDWPASRTVVQKFQMEMANVCTTTRTRLRDLLEEEHAELD
ncbi:uncharacterized protein LOC129590595 isoform X2 [Paramacrobiotus metropolitanus]|uniref:uncharacterized protein LOC129590595 isoform X2 n=1 Tax=Paramacrobiotus metropolitanus TaxID=2943436 RepID=UPI002445AE5F|nr:uncharacterized protein LOC129590595 isoform X2 [Paramacrobiotus metropolitanus]